LTEFIALHSFYVKWEMTPKFEMRGVAQLVPSVELLGRIVGLSIGYVAHAVRRWHFIKSRAVYIEQAANVICKYVRIRATLMMCVDAADSTEVMFGYLSVELI
jgi:hypothetical protein